MNKTIEKLIFLSISIFVLMVAIITIGIIRGEIPIRSMSVLREVRNIFINHLYKPIRLDKIFGDPYKVRFVSNYPSRIYLLDKKLVNSQRRDNEEVIKNMGYDIEDIDSQLMEYAGNQFGSFYELKGTPFLYAIDYDYHVLFASSTSRVLNEFEKSYNLIPLNEQIQRQNSSLFACKLNKFVLLKLGNIWNGPNYDAIMIKLYNDGEMLLNYIWHDFQETQGYSIGRKRVVSVIIPVDRRFIQDKIKRLIEIENALRSFSYDTTLEWIGQMNSDIAMVIKDGDKMKVIHREPVGRNLSCPVRGIWSDVIMTTRLKECLNKLFVDQINMTIEKSRINNIEKYVSFFTQ